SRGVDSADRLDPQLPVAVATPAQGSTRRIQAARVLEGGMYLEKPVYLETERLRDGGRGAVGDGDVDGGYTDCEWGPGDFSVVVGRAAARERRRWPGGGGYAARRFRARRVSLSGGRDGQGVGGGGELVGFGDGGGGSGRGGGGGGCCGGWFGC